LDTNDNLYEDIENRHFIIHIVHRKVGWFSGTVGKMPGNRPAKTDGCFNLWKFYLNPMLFSFGGNRRGCCRGLWWFRADKRMGLRPETDRLVFQKWFVWEITFCFGFYVLKPDNASG
jgi:hypothetical protein